MLNPASTSEKDQTHAICARSPGCNRRERPAALRVLAGAVLMLSLGVAANSATAQTGNRRCGTGPIAGRAETRQPRRPAGDPVEAQLGDIKKRLNITAAQQSQFDQFASVVKQNAQAMDALMQKAAQTAPRRARWKACAPPRVSRKPRPTI